MPDWKRLKMFILLMRHAGSAGKRGQDKISIPDCIGPRRVFHRRRSVEDHWQAAGGTPLLSEF
jgi:hypothetical protein